MVTRPLQRRLSGAQHRALRVWLDGLLGRFADRLASVFRAEEALDCEHVLEVPVFLPLVTSARMERKIRPNTRVEGHGRGPCQPESNQRASTTRQVGQHRVGDALDFPVVRRV